MTRVLRALIVDDDPFAADMLSTRLRQQLPTLDIETVDRPEPRSGHDVYLIDNDFGGIKLGTRLAKSLRATNPESLIVAFSGTLDATTLKELLNAGCNGACEKGQERDLSVLIELVKRFSETQQKAQEDRGIGSVLRSLGDLLKQWNKRLDRLETK
ncbi:MAG: response regulator [Planctomycetota bacterium]